MAPFTWGEIVPDYKHNMKHNMKEFDEYNDHVVVPKINQMTQRKEREFKHLMRQRIFKKETQTGRKTTKIEENEIIDEVTAQIHYTS
jgi:CRISPR/Cas system CMR-associated protein Cmr3 (group 5 of RAMP superfamily)